MVLPMSILLDLALGLVLLSILYNSYQRGFLASLISLAGTAAGFLLAAFASRPLAERVYNAVLAQRSGMWRIPCWPRTAPCRR